MRMSKSLIGLCTLILLAVTFGCGGSGGGSNGSSTGTVSMSITDAKPVLPDNVTNCFVTIDEVLVHSSRGAWKSLPLPKSPTPFTIDLLQFTEGNTTDLVPPVLLESGKYTQIRLSITNASLRFDNGSSIEDVTVTIPSENLKTDKNFDFDVSESAAVDITIDFDLSKSIVVEGQVGSQSYLMKPVLHIVETTEAATIEGFIANSRFAGNYVVITVVDSTGQEYTKIQVDKDTTTGAAQTAYSIFCLVPNLAYTVKINNNPGLDDDPATEGIQDGYDETVAVPSASDPNDVLQPGEIYTLDFYSKI